MNVVVLSLVMLFPPLSLQRSDWARCWRFKWE